MATRGRDQSPPAGYRIDVPAARRGFARTAGRDPAADVLAREIERRMLERLDLITYEPAHVLDAGAGGGAALGPLAARYPKARLIAVDSAYQVLARPPAASGLLHWLRRLGRGAPAALPVCADFAALPIASGTLGLVWSNLALNWASSIPQAFAEWQRVLAIGGFTMFSCYGPDTLRELRDAGAQVHEFVDMHDLGDMLIAAGFAEPVMDMERITLTYPSLEALIADLRAGGRTNVLATRRRGLTGRAYWQALTEAYRRDANGRLPATIEVVYGHAWKPAPRQTADGRAIVRFDRRPGPSLPDPRRS